MFRTSDPRITTNRTFSKYDYKIITHQVKSQHFRDTS